MLRTISWHTSCFCKITEKTMIENLNGGKYNEMDNHLKRYRVRMVRNCLFLDIQIIECFADQRCVRHITVLDWFYFRYLDSSEKRRGKQCYC